MPEELEKKLRKQIAKRRWSKKRKDAYVFGVLRKTGWKPSHQKTKKKKK